MDWPVKIVAATDPRIEPYLNIRDRELLGKQGSFIAEGSVVVRRLLEADDYAPQSALILESRLAGLADVVATMQARNIPVYVANRPIIDAIAGFPMHRGVLAVGARRQLLGVEAVIERLPQDAIVVVCVGISNHDNIGAIFRNARGLGARAIFFDKTSCDPLYRKAIRVSVGSVFDLPHARFEDVEQLRLRLAETGFRQIALSPSGSQDLRSLQPLQRAALYLGAEGPGLPQALLAELETVRIDMSGEFDSLNVATASALALYQLTGSPKADV